MIVYNYFFKYFFFIKSKNEVLNYLKYNNESIQYMRYIYKCHYIDLYKTKKLLPISY